MKSDVLKKLPCRRDDIGEHSLLRVVAPMYASERVRSVDLPEEDLDYALLDIDAVDAISARLAALDFVDDVVASTTHVQQAQKRKRRDLEEDLSVSTKQRKLYKN